MSNPNLPINFRKNTYIGARYVPKFSDTPGSEWDNSIQYEPLTIVLYQGNSYTSKTFVPVGVDIDNDTYWALTGNFNAQVESLRQQLLNKYTYVTPEFYGAKGDGVTDDTSKLQMAINSGRPVALISNYLISSVSISSDTVLRGFNGKLVQKGNSPLIQILNNSQNIYIENIEFEGKSTGLSGNNRGINSYENFSSDTFDSAKNVFINNCRFSNFSIGIALTRSLNIVIENCIFENMHYVPSESAGGYGVLLQTCKNVNIQYNTFQFDVSGRHGVYIATIRNSELDTRCYKVNVSNNIFKGSGTNFERIEAILLSRECEGLVIEHNLFDSVQEPIFCLGTNYATKDIIINGNIINNIKLPSQTQKEVYLIAIRSSENGSLPAENVTITNNVLDITNSEAHGCQGISVHNLNNGLISNNTLLGNFSINAVFVHSTNVVLEGNFNGTVKFLTTNDKPANYILNNVKAIFDIFSGSNDYPSFEIHGYNALVNGQNDITQTLNIIQSINVLENELQVVVTPIFTKNIIPMSGSKNIKLFKGSFNIESTEYPISIIT